MSFGPADYFAFMPLVGTPQSCLDFKNSRCSDSLKSFNGIFSGALQMPMGKHNKHALQEAIRTGPFGLRFLLECIKLVLDIYIFILGNNENEEKLV